MGRMSAAVALYTVQGVEDDSPDHPNAFFLPRLPNSHISLGQLNECFPLKETGDFLFSYLVAGKERIWRTLVEENNNRLFLRVLAVRDSWQEETEGDEPASAPAPAGCAAESSDALPSLQDLHSPAPAQSPTPSPLPSPSPAKIAEPMTPEETKAAAIKDEGNKSFKSGQFPAAIAIYTKALELIAGLDKTKATTKLSVACLGNRAACRIQERDFDQAIQDCSSVLAQDPKNAKALVRRGTSFEHNEKHKKALADFEGALAIDMKNKVAQQSAVRLRKLIKSIYG